MLVLPYVMSLKQLKLDMGVQIVRCSAIHL